MSCARPPGTRVRELDSQKNKKDNLEDGVTEGERDGEETDEEDRREATRLHPLRAIKQPPAATTSPAPPMPLCPKLSRAVNLCFFFSVEKDGE